ncbi:hypothetical protein N7476_009504 [Penicillium atrosanguineum]|uniref:Uncharacterized protein n=1 Tax=Penicillium atrosanguineum TaxID=1132637 RepID=A0A9W9PNF2_9EURO|nr:hypothetical protein N7526_008349 [Penicillium atrosanguineum]KAJ5302705.1 hypothetical protein N7476_009504 [Penicillium atrosanguineum]
MAATQKLYPRGTVKRIVKAHSKRSVSKNADILVSPSQPAHAPRSTWLIAAITDFPRLHAVYARVRSNPPLETL